MASSLRSHTLTTPNTSAVPPTSPQWVQDLDPSKNNHALALRSFHHPSCHVARKSCDLCSFLESQCFVAPAISPKCVMCIAGRDPRFHALCLPDTSNSDDGVDVLEKGPVRRQKSPHSDTTSRAANAIETLPRKPQNVLENGRKPAKTSELPAIIFTSAIVPRHNTENKEESSNTQQESRLGTQTKSNNKPETLVSNSPKRRRLCNDTDEAANERGQHHNAAESSSALKSSFSPPLMVSPDLNKYPSSTHERYLPSTPRTSLDAKKQNNTILWILMPSLSELVPLKLRSCMTMASLFDSVLAVCGLTGQQDKVSGLRATIHKLHDTIVPKPIILKRDLEDSFEVFLDVINAARCWAKEGGHCVVSLKVLMA